MKRPRSLPKIFGFEIKTSDGISPTEILLIPSSLPVAVGSGDPEEREKWITRHSAVVTNLAEPKIVRRTKAP